ncbi:NAD+ synthase [Helicobacter sp. MIT 05-5294]|uniref:NAD+ synthase n=1 Tax=Helicobacter sp. MIT 05-5294 TaxID=1548150 RepID=UPI00051FA9D4|nr:NAD+ synthase [Helicobacter sp. MIT 05-5294]TLD89133.1 NAD+ synthase [Helicobacter sp. MIT 05-5294]
MKDFEAIKQNLVRFITTEVQARGFESVVLGLSGGIDSAVVARLCQLAFPKSHQALLMPSKQSSQTSLTHALELCKSFGISYQILPLNQLQSAFEATLQGLDSNPLRLGNLCARLRMVCLYDYAFANHALVIGTSNKSEIMLGYGTIFGDLASAINPIGNLYKTEIYELAHLLGIPKSIIEKAPSADLYEGQSDEKELGFSYAVLDKIMQLLEKGANENEILQQNLSKEALKLVQSRIARFEFKRKMPQIAQI